jgi:hypothetical protein
MLNGSKEIKTRTDANRINVLQWWYICSYRFSHLVTTCVSAVLQNYWYIAHDNTRTFIAIYGETCLEDHPYSKTTSIKRPYLCGMGGVLGLISVTRNHIQGPPLSPTSEHVWSLPNPHEDHWPQITITDIIVMKEFEILRELSKCDTETRSEHMLLGKWHRWTCSSQGCHTPSICKPPPPLAISAKHNRTRYACT